MFTKPLGGPHLRTGRVKVLYEFRLLSSTSQKLSSLLITKFNLHYSPFHGFWQSFISIEVCRDCIPALASSRKNINGFLCLLIVFLKSKISVKFEGHD